MRVFIEPCPQMLGIVLGATIRVPVSPYSREKDRLGLPKCGAQGCGGWSAGAPGTGQPHASRSAPSPTGGPLLYSGSFRLCVFNFLLISCFLDLTMAELLSVSLLKKAGGWLVLPGDLEPILREHQTPRSVPTAPRVHASDDGALATQLPPPRAS